MDADEPLVLTVGARIRALRKARGLTLNDVAERAGMAVSTLSRLETGKRRPTLEQLLPLARLIGVTLDELVDAPPTGDPRVRLRPVRRDGLVYVPLSRRPEGVRAFKIVYPPRSTFPVTRQRHEGHEWLFVLNGKIQLALGDQVLQLAAGEVAEFDTRTPHFIRSAQEESAEVLVLMGPQGERAHSFVDRGRRDLGPRVGVESAEDDPSGVAGAVESREKLASNERREARRGRRSR